jgi:tetratricopeptide (TPR) repeat protein
MAGIRIFVGAKGAVWAKGRGGAMPRQITHYRVFIGSPGGLETERQCFRETLRKFSELHGDNVRFDPVGWEDAPPAIGRPQEVINRHHLDECDYAVFILHDRWGSPTGTGLSSGTGEEFARAETLYQQNKIRNIALFFKAIEPSKLNDPGAQLRQVMDFKNRIEEDKQYLFKECKDENEFSEILERLLVDWKKRHTEASNPPKSDLMGLQPAAGPASNARFPPPPFGYWIAEAYQSSRATNHCGALFCAEKALEAAATDDEWAAAKEVFGLTKLRRDEIDEAINAFTEIVSRLQNSTAQNHRSMVARALFNKGVALRAIGRGDEEISAYDDVLSRFGTASEPEIHDLIARALLNKGAALDKHGRGENAIAAYDDLLARFGEASESELREAIASAMVNKGAALGKLGRAKDAITVLDDVLARFGAASEPEIRIEVDQALVNKGIALGVLGRSGEAIAIFDDLLSRIGVASEPMLQKQVAITLVNKSVALGQLGRQEEVMVVCNDLLARFGEASEPELREATARAMVNKGAALDKLGRAKDAIAIFDDLLTHFGAAGKLELRVQVASALAHKGSALGQLGRNEEAIAVYDDFLARFGAAREPALRQVIAVVLLNKGVTLHKLGRSGEAIAVCEDLLVRFGTASEPEIHEAVAMARKLKKSLQIS